MPTITQMPRAQMSPPTGDAGCARSNAAQAGYTLVEMIVVCLMIAIMMALVTSTFRGTKKAAFSKAGQASAFAYQDAVEAYMADNGQRTPKIGDPNAWPNADRGPVDPQFSNKPYMRSIPDEVQEGLVDLTVPNEVANRSAQTIIVYHAEDGAPGLYTFEVWVVQGTESKKYLDCIVTNRANLKVGEKRCVS